MGSFLSGVLGTNSQVGVTPQQPLQQYNYSGQLDPNFMSQQNLAQLLEQQTRGQGPNPAAAMLQQAQNQNSAQAAQSYSANRSLNAGLAARNASNQQAFGNQQAANQASILRQNQQLSAQGQLGGLYGQIGNQAIQGMGAQNQAFNQANAINAGVSAGNQQAAQGIVGGLLGASGQALAAGGGGGKAHGGMIGYADGGLTMPEFGSQFSSSGPTLMDSPAFSSAGSGSPAGSGNQNAAMGKAPMSNLNFGNPVNALMSFESMGRYAAGGMAGPKSFVARHLKSQGMPMKMGGGVPGSASVPGDSYQNDTVKAVLSPGEIVIPRSVVNAKDAPDKARAFVAAVLAKKGRRTA